MVCIYCTGTFFVSFKKKKKKALCSQHFPITSVSREITAKEELKLKNYFSKAQHGKLQAQRAEQAEPPCPSHQTRRKGDGINTSTQWCSET